MYVYNSNLIYRSTDVFNVQLMSRKESCQSCIFFTPSFIRKVKIGFFQSGQQLCSFLEKYFDCKPKIYIFSTSAKIALSCDIKSLFRKSVDKKLQIFISIFHPVLLHFFDFFIMLNLSITKKIKFPPLLIKVKKQST